MTIYFTSDLHFGHKNILKYNPKHRQYRDVNEMNEDLVRIWNETVKPDDTIYHLGDFCFGSKTKTENFKARLNGNIVWIKGNHDKDGELYKEISINGQHIVLFHFPIGSWNKQARGSWCLHGHSHGSYQHSKGKMLDVGWDAHGKILSFEDIKRMLDKVEIYNSDHH